MTLSEQSVSAPLRAEPGKHETFASKVRRARELDSEGVAWPGVRVRVLRNYTLENLEPLLKYECGRAKLRADVSFSDFDTYAQEIFDAESVTNTGGFDIVVLSLWLDGVLARTDGTATSVATSITSTLDALRERVAATICVTTVVGPAHALRDEDIARHVNAALFAYAQANPRVRVIDLAQLVARRGETASIDPRFWYQAGAPLRNELLGDLARELAAVAIALKGGAKKVLVLDCDNTLWGGVVGEDGLEGIALGPTSYPGNAYYDFQRQLLALKARGVILALCSKNNEADALAVFDAHPHSLLKRADFAAWRINWADKATNVRDLARELNVGLDSMVFVDDNAVECEFVATSIPEVTVLQAPARPYELPALLREFRGFVRLSESAEDARRTELYLEERQREEAKSAFVDLESYLRSLELIVEVNVATKSDIARVSQLTQKTNQFNLTTRRYSEGEIESLTESAEHAVLTLRMRDRFGDYGLTGVGIIARTGDSAEIDTLLMSCRVLGRGAEMALLSELFEFATRAWHIDQMRGTFIPTRKNQQVTGFYERVGFDRMTEPTGESASVRYSKSASPDPHFVPDYVTVVRLWN